MADIICMMLSGWAIVALVFFILWRVAVVQHNAGWVDVGWSFTLVLLVGWFAIWADGVVWRRIFYLLLPAYWGLRLARHILARLLREEFEDPRYRELRRHWGLSADRNFFFFFQAQGLANLLLAAPILLLMQSQRTAVSIFDILGALLMIGAIYGESVADRQLVRWKANPANKGRTCREGLWAVSRHPNYFFEWLHWVAWPVLGLAVMGTPLAHLWPVTLLGPVIMLVLLMQFTGIPYTEKQAIRSKGEDYQKYQREVSKFFPWFVRK